MGSCSIPVYWLKVLTLVSVNLLLRLSKPWFVLAPSMGAWKASFWVEDFENIPQVKRELIGNVCWTPCQSFKVQVSLGPSYIVTSFSKSRELGWRRCWENSGGKRGIGRTWRWIEFHRSDQLQSYILNGKLLNLVFTLKGIGLYQLGAISPSCCGWFNGCAEGFNSGQGPCDDHSFEEKQKFRVQIACVRRTE